MQESQPGAAEFESAGVYDPAAADAPERLAVFEYLVGLGATIDDLVDTPWEELPLLASTIALWGRGGGLTIDELATRVGISRELVARAWRAAGFPDPDSDSGLRAFNDRDVEMFEILRASSEFFGEDVTIQLTRVLGAAAARVADASTSAFMVNIAPQAMERDASGLELSRANAESMVLLDGVTRAFDAMLRHHIQRGFRPQGEMAGIVGADLVERSVGFADLVDSTAWTQALELGALSVALTEFDAVASEIVVSRGGRLVKLIGDEAMFVAHDPAVAADIALALIEVFADHDVLPPVRAGVATGEVVARDGDFSGAVVNLAARAVKIATPSTLYADRATRDALRAVDSFTCGEEESHALKGFAEPVRLSRIGRSGALAD